MNKQFLLLGIIVMTAILGIAGFFIANNGTACVTKQEMTVKMIPGGFSPNEFTTQRCTKVVFVNEDTKPRWPASDYHPTHGIYPEFDPLEGIEPGASWSYTFDKPGRWRFHDHLSPMLRGTITVQDE